MSDYEYHIFVSYRRSDEHWTRWARQNVADVLQTLLAPTGGVDIFIDEKIETGVNWPNYLARALTRSRILIPLLSRAYFQSEWCRLELSLMYHRQSVCQVNCPGDPPVLILPFVHDDGKDFPTEIRQLQPKEIHEYANPFILPDTPKYFEFSEVLRQECPRIESALAKAPNFDPSWESLARDKFLETFRIQVGTQNSLPTQSLSSAILGGNAT